MAESKGHKTVKQRAAGKTGKTEVVRKQGRIDAETRDVATEVERSGDPRRIQHALEKLKDIRGKNRVLMVPASDQDDAVRIAKDVSLTVTVKNLLGGNPTRVEPKWQNRVVSLEYGHVYSSRSLLKGFNGGASS